MVDGQKVSLVSFELVWKMVGNPCAGHFLLTPTEPGGSTPNTSLRW